VSSTQSEYIGVLGRAHGLDGTMQLADAIILASGLPTGSIVSIGYSREFAKAYTVAEFQQTEYRTLIRLKEVGSAELAASLTEQAVFAFPADIGLTPAERYRIGDVEGAVVVTDSGQTLGIITDVWLLPANDVWVVTTPSQNTIPLPVINDVIIGVDIESRVVTVRLLDGLDTVDIHEDLEPDA